MKTIDSVVKTSVIFQTAIIIILITISSCSGRKNKMEKKDIIPQSEMVVLLTDIYLTDGLLNLSEIQMKHASKDSVITYMEVLGNYGYTKEQMDKSLQYYFTNRPKKLKTIYDQVLRRLTELQSEVQAKTERIPEIINLWPGRTSYSLPQDGIADMVSFEYLLSDTGLYTLSLGAIVFEDDQSLNPRITVWFWKPDTTESGTLSYWEEIPLQKDGVLRQYKLSATVPDTSFISIRGVLLNHDPKPGRWEKHCRIDNPMLTRKDYTIEQ
jgi:hypothetical protein